MTGSNAALPAHAESGDLMKIQAGRARQSCLLCNSRLARWLLGTHLGSSVISLSLRSHWLSVLHSHGKASISAACSLDLSGGF